MDKKIEIVDIERLIEEAERSIVALSLELPSPVYEDHSAKMRSVIDELKAMRKFYSIVDKLRPIDA